MFRALFFACGVFVTLCGGLLLFVDRIVLTNYATQRLRHAVEVTPAEEVEPPSTWRLVSTTGRVEPDSQSQQVIDPPDWGAFGLLSIGSVALLYTLSLPGRKDEDEDS